jgi:hypothetical protein
MVGWLFPPEVRLRLRILSIGAVLLALASWLPHFDSGVVGLLAALLVCEAGAIALALMPWSDGEVKETCAALRAVRDAARILAARRWSRS